MRMLTRSRRKMFIFQGGQSNAVTNGKVPGLSQNLLKWCILGKQQTRPGKECLGWLVMTLFIFQHVERCQGCLADRMVVTVTVALVRLSWILTGSSKCSNIIWKKKLHLLKTLGSYKNEIGSIKSIFKNIAKVTITSKISNTCFTAEEKLPGCLSLLHCCIVF